MAQAFNLYGTLGLNTAKFKANLNKAEKNLDSFKAKYKRVTKQFKRSFKEAEKSLKTFAASVKGPALAIAGLTTAFVASQKAAQDSARQFDDLSKSLDISVERAQALTAAFAGQGLESNDVGDAMNTIVDRAKDAQDGMQSFVDDFALIGIEVDELKNKNPNQLFDTFADAIKNTQDPISRQAALVRILGDDLGRKLGPALMRGSQGFRDLQEEMQASGVLMSQELIDKSQRANEAFNKLTSVVKLGLTKAFVALSPYMEAFANYLRDNVRLGPDFENKMKSAFTAVTRAVAVFADGLHGVKILFQSAVTAANAFATGLLKGFQAVLDGIGAVATGLKNLIVDNLLKLAEKLAPFNDMMASLAASLREIAAVEVGSPQILDDAVIANAEALNKSVSKLRATLSEDLPSKKLERALSEATDDVVIRGEGARQGMSSAETGAEKGREFSKAFKREVNVTLKGSVESALEGDFQSISDMWKNLLRRMAADALAANLSSAFGLGGDNSGQFSGGNDFFGTLSNVVSGAFGGFGGGSGSGGAGNVINNAINITTPNAASFTPSRARIFQEMQRGNMA